MAAVQPRTGRPAPAPHPPWPPRASHPGAQVLVSQKVTMGVYKGVTTSELDELAAETAASLTATHPDYALVGAGRGRAERGRAWRQPRGSS